MNGYTAYWVDDPAKNARQRLAFTKVYTSLAPDEKQEIDAIAENLTKSIKGLGNHGAIELIGKIGLFLNDGL